VGSVEIPMKQALRAAVKDLLRLLETHSIMTTHWISDKEIKRIEQIKDMVSN
jgi:hypothetical protein